MAKCFRRSCMVKQIYNKNGKNQEKPGFLSKRTIFRNFCPTTKRQFFLTRPEKKIDRRKSRRGISTNAKNAVKHGTDKE